MNGEGINIYDMRIWRPSKVYQNIDNAINEFRAKGYVTGKPFPIGKVDKRIKDYADRSGIQLASDKMYMSPKQIAHTLRESKVSRGVSVTRNDLINFPQRRKYMKLYHDNANEGFIFVDKSCKFIVVPTYRAKISGEKTNVVYYITATKITSHKEFEDTTRYTKIK